VSSAVARLQQVSVKLAEAYLHQGQVVGFAAPTVVTTVLGSCVSVCLWDERSGVGGMNHFLLPEPAPGQAPSARYAAAAFEQLLARLAALRARPDRLQAKIFGGATLAKTPDATSLGLRNAEIARRLLEERRIPVIAEDTGGSCGRKLRFETHAGTAWVRFLGEHS
jgi:chemotaxis protein CheD